LFYIMINN